MPRPRHVNGVIPDGHSGLKAASFTPERANSQLEILLYQTPKYIPTRVPTQPPISLLQPTDSDAFIVDKVVTPFGSVVLPDDSQSRIRRVLNYVIAWPDNPTAWELVPCCNVLNYVSPRTVEDWEYRQTLLLQHAGESAKYIGGGGRGDAKLESERKEKNVALTTNGTFGSPEMKEQQIQDAREIPFLDIDSATPIAGASERQKQTFMSDRGPVVIKRPRGRPPKHMHMALLQAAANEQIPGQWQQQLNRLSLEAGKIPLPDTGTPPVMATIAPAGRQRTGFSLSTLFSPSNAFKIDPSSPTRALSEPDPGPDAFNDCDNEDWDGDVDMLCIDPVSDDDENHIDNDNDNESDTMEEGEGGKDVDGGGKEAVAAVSSSHINATTALHCPLASGALRSPRPQPRSPVATTLPGELSEREYSLMHAQKQ